MLNILKVILVIILFFVILFMISFFTYFIYFRFFKKMELPKNLNKYKKPSFFKRVFLEFPKQFWLDRFNCIPGEFKEYGLHLICGEQGSGKTTACVDLILNCWKQKYPRLKVYTNMFLKGQDGEITHWKDLLRKDRNNGVYGVVNLIDEIQSWFSSLQSKDFPPEMLSEISQQRKQRKLILGTSQIFGRVAKPIREQTSFVYLPRTFAGVLTVVRVSKPIYYDEETFSFKKFIKTYFFVHNPFIRDSFDTYLKVQKMCQSGFKSDLQRQALQDSNISIKNQLEN